MSTFVHTLDWVGSILSFCSTVFFIKADVKGWQFGIAATLLNSFLYGWLGIYGDMSLEGMYFIMMIYGWYVWLHGGKHHDELTISHITVKHALILIVLASGAAYLLEAFLHYDTNSQVPYLDAITTVISLTAQWLTCRKIIESWILWLVVDAFYVGLFIYKGIPIHSILHALYVLMAVAGYWRWYRLMPRHKVPEPI